MRYIYNDISVPLKRTRNSLTNWSTLTLSRYRSFLVLCNFFFQIFFPGLSLKVNVYLRLVSDSFNLKYFDIFWGLCKYRGHNLWKSSKFKKFCKHYLECFGFGQKLVLKKQKALKIG